jgi:bifunctional DNA-binding transcriptional regulator/antitoxin component of YhaV-PrlF toxin-antitoxin module
VSNSLLKYTFGEWIQPNEVIWVEIMKLKKLCDANHQLLTILPALVLLLNLPLAARADDISTPQSQPASADSSSSPDSSSGTLLQGGVSERAAFEGAMTKLRAKADMTDDDFRNLGIGTLGYEALLTGPNNSSRVEKVFPGSPAEQAGIRKGDIVIRDADAAKDLAQGRPTGSNYAVVLRRAGSVDEVTLLRDKQPVTLQVTRMNIADIADNKVRKMWEKMILNLSNAPDGVYSIPKPW